MSDPRPQGTERKVGSEGALPGVGGRGARSRCGGTRGGCGSFACLCRLFGTNSVGFTPALMLWVAVPSRGTGPSAQPKSAAGPGLSAAPPRCVGGLLGTHTAWAHPPPPPTPPASSSAPLSPSAGAAKARLQHLAKFLRNSERMPFVPKENHFLQSQPEPVASRESHCLFSRVSLSFIPA